jgi:hypothetical protein
MPLCRRRFLADLCSIRGTQFKLLALFVQKYKYWRRRLALQDLKYEVPSPDTVPFKHMYYQGTKNY